MAKKKPKSSKGKAGGRKRAKPDKKSQAATPADTSPRGLAQELMHQAYNLDDPDQQADLAQKAMALDPAAVDPYILLAELAPATKEALRLYEQGVAVGQRALGVGSLNTDTPEAWSFLRARRGVAFSLWLLGRRDEAITQAGELLRLDPNDFPGLRYTVLGWLLSQDRDADAVQLLARYPDDESAAWTYTRVLVSFRQHGDTPETLKRFKRARKSNKHVPGYLLGDKEPPEDMPDHYVPGAPSEAVQYVGGFLAAWRGTAGALDFLRQAIQAGRKNQAGLPAAVGPDGASKKRLRKLEQRTEVWQVDCRRLPAWTEDGGRPVRPWLVLVINLGSEQVIGNNTSGQDPTPELIWDTLAQAIQQPLMDTPHRPTEIQYTAGRCWETLVAHLAEIDVRLTPHPALAEMDQVFPQLIERLVGQTEPGLLDVPGVTPDLVSRFYDAAASYYQQAPWRRVGYEAAIEVRCDKFHSGPWYGVVMGQTGLTFGLALYEDLDVLRKMWTEDASNEENARRTVGTSVTFGNPTEIPVTDLDAAERYSWKVARPDAYPTIFHKERGLSMRPPLAWELELMEGCLRALPDFVRHRTQDDTTPEQLTVSAGTGTLTLTLAWVGEDTSVAPIRRPVQEDSERDDLLEAAMDKWSAIQKAYRDFAEKQPIILYDIQEERIYAYPYKEFKADLSKRSQGMLEVQYRDAKRDNKIVVFVRDNEQRRLVSFSLELEE